MRPSDKICARRIIRKGKVAKRKVSVIIPVYNVEKYLRKCLDSVFAQDYADYEVICVNDGSTDGSGKILDEYADRHANLIVRTQENRGLGAARNAGVAAATGEYVVFLDSDDFLRQGYFSAAVQKMEADGADLVMFNPILYDSKTGRSAPYRSMVDFYQFSREGGFAAEEHPLLLSFNGCWDKVYRRALLEENGIVFPCPRIYEDVTYGIFAQVCAERISVHKEGFYYYRKNTGKSITDREINNKAYRADFLKNLWELRDFLRKKGCGENVYAGVVLYMLGDGMFHLCNTRPYGDFADFFHALADVFTEKELSAVRVWRSEKIDWFLDVLTRGDVRACKKRIVYYLNQPLQLQYKTSRL